MIYKKLVLRNFLAYKSETIDFEKLPDIFTLCGENGAGKTSLTTDAPLFALYGIARGTDNRGSGTDDLIYLGEDRMYIELEFEMAGQNIVIKREKFKDGKSSLQLIVDGNDVTEGKVETQNRINNIIKMTPDVFESSVCIAQGKSGKFMQIGASKRKDVLYDILSLEVYEKLEQEAKNRKKCTNEQLSDIDFRLKNYENLIANKDIYQQQIKDSQTQINTSIVELEKLKTELENELSEKAVWQEKVKKKEQNEKKITTLKSDIQLLESNIAKTNELIDKCQEYISKEQEVNNQLNNIKQNVDELNSKKIDLTGKISTYKAENNNNLSRAKEYKDKFNKLKNYNEAICSQCGQEVDEHNKEKTLEEYKQEGIKYINASKQLETLITQLENELLDVNKNYTSYNSQYNDFLNKKNTIDQAKIKLQNANDNLESYQERLQNSKKDLIEAQKEVIENVENKTWKDIQLKNSIDSLQSIINSLNSKIAIANNEILKIEEAENKINDLLEQKDILLEEVNVFEQLVLAWGKKGIPANIIENAIPEIEKEANDFLNRMTEGRMSLEFITQKSNKSNDNTIETLDIVVSDELGQRKYELYSGGEKFRIDFSIHMGIAIFLANRAGAPVKTFVIDEGFGSLDDSGIEQFVDAIYLTKRYFDKIIVITHLESLKTAFTNCLEVYKTAGNGSKTRIIA